MVPGENVNVPAVLGVPEPVKTMICGPVMVKLPVAENETPLPVPVETVYVPTLITLTVSTTVLDPSKAVPGW